MNNLTAKRVQIIRSIAANGGISIAISEITQTSGIESMFTVIPEGVRPATSWGMSTNSFLLS